MEKKICYICHPVGGDIEGNLAAVRMIIQKINNTPAYAHIVPFAPWYSDVVSGDDTDPVQRQRGLHNDIAILSRKGMVDELWVFGNHVSAGMELEINAALKNRIQIHIKSSSPTLNRQVIELRDKFLTQSN